MKTIRTALALAVLCCLISPAKGQYTLDEIGVNAGGGYGFFLNPEAAFRGPVTKASAFYSHYFCGKAYGIQAQAGIGAVFPGAQNGPAVFPLVPEEGEISLQRIQAEVGFFFKLRPHEYHRRKEWAFVIGPVLPIPISTTAKISSPSDNYSGDWDILLVRKFISPVIHASFQFRRRLGDDLSYFIQPGVEYGPTAAFESDATSFQPFNVFLTFGISFWEKRG